MGLSELHNLVKVRQLKEEPPTGAEVAGLISCGQARLWGRHEYVTIDFAQRAGLYGIQEWLGFYFKSPMAAPGLQPEHDLFIQQMKLKNTLRHVMGSLS